MNLEAYQKRAAAFADFGTRRTVIYLPQLMCLAFGYDENQAMLHKNMSVTGDFLGKFRRGAEAEPDAPAELEQQEARAG
jgi:heterodisulfide reductase subunit B